MSIVPYNRGNLPTQQAPPTSNLPTSSNPFGNIDLPYIPRGTSKVLFEFSKLLIHDDRTDIGKFTYIGHPSRSHHWFWGGIGIAASTLTGMLKKLNETFDELEDEIDPNDRMSQDLLHIGRALQMKANEKVEDLREIAGNPPLSTGEIHYQQTSIPKSIPLQRHRSPPIYMGTIPRKTNTVPALPDKKDIRMPTFLNGKGKPK